MYIELKDGSCFDIYEDKSTPTAVVLMPLGKQQELNNAYKAFKKDGNLSHFCFKTSTGTAAKFDNYIFDSMSVQGAEGNYILTMLNHPMSETEVLVEKMKAMEELMETVRSTQEAQNEVLDYILMGQEEEVTTDGEVSGDENQTGEA